MEQDFGSRLTESANAVETALAAILSRHPQEGERVWPERLLAAMRHGTLGGGKRLRPFLLLQSAALFGVARDEAMQAACALECVHCYSLIHDDLPAMDDDDLRRGAPTVHKAFDEATAILAGDALLTLAFDLVGSEGGPSDSSVRAELVTLLARAAGGGGMIGGQMLDIAAETNTPDETGIRTLQAMKTGALIRFACEAGAVLGCADAQQRASLSRFGEGIGLAFQLADDLLDVTASSEAMGKATGKDAGQGKGTLVALHGLERTREMLRETVEDAISALDQWGDEADTLRATARFVASRTS